MQKKKIFRFASLLISLELIFAPFAPAQALDLGGITDILDPAGSALREGVGSSMPSASQSAGEVENRYHVNSESIQTQGETLNVADQKKVTPEVSLFFSPSDPKEGEKITARSFPIYFSTDTSKLYFTWYLQRELCRPGSPVTPQCDLDNNGILNHNDWKITAHRILASNDLDLASVNYSADTDADGYQARLGGDNRVNVPNHCYYHDNASGENYELVENAGDITWGCGALQPVCMVGSTNITAGNIDVSAGGGGATGGASGSGGDASGGTATASGTSFVQTTGLDYPSGTPYCLSDGTVGCSTGVPCCVSNPATARSCTQALTTCEGNSEADSNPICRHLFPEATGYWSVVGGVDTFVPVGGLTAGDGTYGASEERAWQTDPNDPDTADNGNKDEANIVGLGRDTFTWNYLGGDRVGVVVEGTSMIPTKHQDSSNGIMWGFSKNNCPIAGSTGAYSKSVSGYDVIIPTIEMDLNDCLARNLVDPTEGGQATNLELTLAASPDDPVNDISTRGDGDLLDVTATINNAAKGIQNIYYDWRVELSPDGTANPTAPWINITTALNNLPDGRKLLSAVRGNGVNKVQLNMNIRNTDVLNGNAFSTYLQNGIGHIRFRVDGAENFSTAGASRRGRSNIIVKFNASADRILAHTVTVSGDPARISLNAANEICSGIANPTDPVEQQALNRLDGKLCRVIKNEIVGLEVPGTDLSNFSWTINGQPLVCNTKVSSTNCFDDRQGNINFFPIVGNVGDTFSIAVTANRINSTTSTEKTVSISRVFKIVQPAVNVISNDQNNVWPKLLGQFVDTAGAAYTEFSKDTLETYAGNTVPVRAIFTPDFLANNAPPQVERSWSVDGVTVGDGSANTISFPADKIGKAVYNVSISAVYRPSTLTRQAMEDIWGLSALDTTEIYFSNNTQVEQPDTTNITYTGAKKYYALIASYLPGSVLFSLKVLFSVFLILFASGVVFALIPNVPEQGFTNNRRRE